MFGLFGFVHGQLKMNQNASHPDFLPISEIYNSRPTDRGIDVDGPLLANSSRLRSIVTSAARSLYRRQPNQPSTPCVSLENLSGSKLLPSGPAHHGRVLTHIPLEGNECFR